RLSRRRRLRRVCKSVGPRAGWGRTDRPQGRAPHPPSGSIDPTLHAMSAKTILVVDDEPRIAEIARDYLERAGFRVMVAGTGPDALAAARTRSPDLIVLDL